ncbi:MAG: ATP-binding protein [Planctomycetes bacterium]|nr:ATP-binding protein [Planctomycetota bacterium]
MLNTLTIQNYRGFQAFALEGATHVNLLVGRNNSGKTALLEAVHFLASGGDPAVLQASTKRRAEVAVSTVEGRGLPDMSHLFFGHECVPGVSFTLSGANGTPSLKVIVGEYTGPAGVVSSIEDARNGGLMMSIEGGVATPYDPRAFLLSKEGALLGVAKIGMRPHRFDPEDAPAPVVFVSPEKTEPLSVAHMWSQALAEKREVEVRDAVRILDPSVEDIVFQTIDSTSFQVSLERSGILVGFVGSRRRVPLGSMGDGMRRLLVLAVSLVRASGGLLLIDEIDTGLHYSIMPKMWEMVVQTAMKSNTQVFATTHSADCIRGLAALCWNVPDLQECVCVHKIEPRVGKSIRFTGGEILLAVEQDIEMR